jgi:hypothetical protein
MSFNGQTNTRRVFLTDFLHNKVAQGNLLYCTVLYYGLLLVVATVELADRRSSRMVATTTVGLQAAIQRSCSLLWCTTVVRAVVKEVISRIPTTNYCTVLEYSYYYYVAS